MGGGLLASGSFAIGGCTAGGSNPIPEQTGEFGPTGEVSIDLNCGELVVTAAGGPGWQVGGTTSGDPPQVTASATSLAVRGDDVAFPIGGVDLEQRWEIALPVEPVLRVEIGVNAGSARVDLEGASISAFVLELNAGEIVADLAASAELGELSVGVNAGSVAIELPDAPFNGSLDVNAGEIRFCVPAETGLRVETDSSIVASYNLGDLREVAEDEWESANYATATNQIELRIEANAGSIRLDPAGTCDA
jgi:hypothetical protein